MTDVGNPFVDVEIVGNHMLLARCVGCLDDHRFGRFIEGTGDLASAILRSLKAKHAIDDFDIGKQIGDGSGMGHAFDVLEKHWLGAIKNFLQTGKLKIRIDLFFGFHEIAIGTEPVDRGPKTFNLLRRGDGFFNAFVHDICLL